MSKYDYTCLKHLCEKNNIKLIHDYSCNINNIFSNIEGECLNKKCNHNFSKSFRYLLHIFSFRTPILNEVSYN
uniref:Uncharacterized protein n=1 Tax=viral metagenome TaxID=1070528 RepID=A0A6C0DFI7_9ZZZZ